MTHSPQSEEQNIQTIVSGGKMLMVLLGIAVTFLGWIGINSYEMVQRLATIEVSLSRNDDMLQDHEHRIRSLEREDF